MKSVDRANVGLAVALEAAWLLKLCQTESFPASLDMERGKRKFLERYNRELMRMNLAGRRVPDTAFDRGSPARKRDRLRALTKERARLLDQGMSERTPRIVKLSRLIERLFNELNAVDLFTGQTRKSG